MSKANILLSLVEDTWRVLRDIGGNVIYKNKAGKYKLNGKVYNSYEDAVKNINEEADEDFAEDLHKFLQGKKFDIPIQVDASWYRRVSNKEDTTVNVQTGSMASRIITYDIRPVSMLETDHFILKDLIEYLEYDHFYILHTESEFRNDLIHVYAITKDDVEEYIRLTADAKDKLKVKSEEIENILQSWLESTEAPMELEANKYSDVSSFKLHYIKTNDEVLSVYYDPKKTSEIRLRVSVQGPMSSKTTPYYWDYSPDTLKEVLTFIEDRLSGRESTVPKDFRRSSSLTK